MKCSTTRMRGKELADFKRNLHKEIQDSMDTVLKDREMMAGCRAQWMFMVALYRSFGFGKKRLRRVMAEIGNMLPGLIEDRSAEVMDEMLILDLERIGLDIKDTHGEYFECADRLKEFGKYIDGEQERKEAEAKEKELLDKLKRKEMIFGKETPI